VGALSHRTPTVAVALDPSVDIVDLALVRIVEPPPSQEQAKRQAYWRSASATDDSGSAPNERVPQAECRFVPARFDKTVHCSFAFGFDGFTLVPIAKRSHFAGVAFRFSYQVILGHSLSRKELRRKALERALASLARLCERLLPHACARLVAKAISYVHQLVFAC
jgi:hypothetical protein